MRLLELLPFLRRPISALVISIAPGLLGAIAMGAEADVSPRPTPVLIVAHRGECFSAPENTMASFELAWKKHDPAIELDIHLTADGKVIVCHDADTYRTSGNKERVVMKTATLAEIQKVDVGSFRGAEYAGQKCPTLDEVYAEMPDGTRCYTESKAAST